MKRSLMYISLHLIWFHEIHIEYVKRKPPWTMKGKIMNTKENQVFSLLLFEHIFCKKTTKKKPKWKRSVWVKPWLKNCMYTSAFNNIFVELLVNDKEEFRRYLRINTATYHYFFFAWQNNRDVLYYTFSTASAAACFDIWLLPE